MLWPIRPLISFEAWARALGQVAHLLGHHREALAGVAGPGRLDRGVQGQQVGLEGDLVDHADDVADLLRLTPRCGPWPTTASATTWPPDAATSRAPAAS